jgi:hypothetical protein
MSPAIAKGLPPTANTIATTTAVVVVILMWIMALDG